MAKSPSQTTSIRVPLPTPPPRTTTASPTAPTICRTSDTITITNQNTDDGSLTNNQQPHYRCHQRHHNKSRHPLSATPTSAAPYTTPTPNTCSNTSGHPTSDITLRLKMMISTSKKASP